MNKKSTVRYTPPSFEKEKERYGDLLETVEKWGKHVTGVGNASRNDGRCLEGSFLRGEKEIELPAGSVVLVVVVTHHKHFQGRFVKREGIESKTGTLVQLWPKSQGGPKTLIKDGDFRSDFGKFRDAIEGALARAGSERERNQYAVNLYDATDEQLVAECQARGLTVTTSEARQSEAEAESAADTDSEQEDDGADLT